MLFRKKIQKACAYCSHAGKVNDESMLCKKYGFVSGSHHCRRFRYDPLKRVPMRVKVQDFSKYRTEDFSL